MQNHHIADVFDEMADLLEIAGESSFRVRAYRSGAQVIRDLPTPVSVWIAEGRDLTSIEGIGSTLADKSKTLVTTGNLPALEELRQRIPNSLRTFLRIPGLGAKKVAVLHRELGVVNLEQLRAACEANLVQAIKGFGNKTQQAILDGLAIAEQAGQRLLRDEADQLVASLRQHMLQSAAIEKIEFTGSYRRGKETVGDIDIVIVSGKPEEVMDHFMNYGSIQETLVRGPTKSSVRVSRSFQVDLRVVPEASWGATLQYFTGSKAHNVVLRGIAKKLGLRLNEYGLFPVDDDKNPIAGNDEAEVYQALGLPWIAPEFRENRFEWQEDLSDFAASVVQLDDIRGDLHMHTTATDGENTLEEMVQAAFARGLSYIAITDHSQRVSIARGLNSERALEQWSAIDRINSDLDVSKFRVFKGIECDILENGDLDLPDEVLSQADWVMASIHFGQKQSREQITDRILRAIRHPSVSAISHPTGRLLGRREAYEVDLESVMQAAAEYGKCLEINANPMRLDLDDIQAMSAASKGVMIVISTDAHSIANLDLMKYGIQVARRAGLQREQIINTRSLEEFQDYLNRK